MKGSGTTTPQSDARLLEVLDASDLVGSSALVWLRDHAQDAMNLLGITGEVRVRIVGDSDMAAAHERYSGIPGTTDVLTFDLRDANQAGAAGSGGPLDTDIWICADEAQREASARGLTVERELLLYIVHGILHCLGYDDHDEGSHRAMHAEEDRILAAIGRLLYTSDAADE